MDFNVELGALKTDTFSRAYPLLNSAILNGAAQESRNGETKEFLDFKTQLTNPYRRCVGGYKRDINIFFLLAEAMWIAMGKKDVKFLTHFNKRMADFSDDGETFHAPYGYRMRHWGVRTEDKFIDDTVLNSRGYDQVLDAIKLFTENPNSRQVVMSIWNPSLDLGYKTKDIPCNDMVMMKIRDGKFITTIQNRSNDLHWGLPTNIFQFSFLTELMSSCLGIELGTQTHNSQSLHIYNWQGVAERMENEYKTEEGVEMYDGLGAVEKKIDFNFSHEVPANRFREIEYFLQIILNNVSRLTECNPENEIEIKALAEFSDYLYNSYLLLKVYVEYKHKLPKVKSEEEKDIIRMVAISDINVISANYDVNWDIAILAKNFFISRLSNKNKYSDLGKL